MKDENKKSELAYSNYEEFQEENRKIINNRLNMVLWFSILTGPAIAIGVKFGIFPEVNYFTCIVISLYMLFLSLVHFFLVKKWPDSIVTGFIALIALNVLLVVMAFNHVYINLTWFLVPLLSLLFVDKSIYLVSLAMNYIFMVIATWMIAPYAYELRVDYNSPIQYFANYIGGYTIETIIMLVARYFLGKTGAGYFRELIEKNKVIKDTDERLKDQLSILESMSEIYSHVNLIDYEEGTETSIRDKNLKATPIDLEHQTHTVMSEKIMLSIVSDQLVGFKEFTNIQTLRTRLLNKKSIYAEFISMVTGWFRAQYITVETGEDGYPTKVIYTIQNIDNEKRKEEHLIRISLTDELTRLYNRRCYEEDCKEIRNTKLAESFVLLSVDVNGLKVTNDTKGHAAGDELIKASADCLIATVGAIGKAYRVGGDEFLAIIHTNDPDKICEQLKDKAAKWKGMYVENVSLSIGYATSKNNPDENIDGLERIADANMYKEKEKYYREKGIERRIW